MHKTQVIITHTASISYSFGPRLCLQPIGSFYIRSSYILRLVDVYSLFSLRYAECEPGIKIALTVSPEIGAFA